MRLILIAIVIFLAGLPWLTQRRSEDDRSQEFQIPKIASSLHEAPFYQEEILDADQKYPMAHVASLCELPDGTLAATWYAGSGEVQPDLQIYFTTKKISKRAWSAPRVIMTRAQAASDLQRYIKALGNALIFSDAQGTLHLLYVTISMGKWSGSMLNLTSSHDCGVTWSRSERLALSPFFNLSELVKNAPVPLVNGAWVIPMYQEFLGKFSELLWLTPHNGRWSYSKSRITGGCSFFQPSMIVLGARRAVVFFRDYLTTGKIAMASTEDVGRFWSNSVLTTLPNHDAGISSLSLPNGWLLLAFNDSTVARDNLRLALSKDEGRSWQRIATIAEEPGGDFSYPYLMQTHDGIIHLLYSWKRKHIRHVVFNASWIAAQKITL
ncbi:MAG: exo-alpha-sialidase [Chthoniobacterales bacterium]